MGRGRTPVLLHEEHYAPGEALLVSAEFHPGQGVVLTKEFYLNGHIISRESIDLPCAAMDELMAGWIEAHSEGASA